VFVDLDRGYLPVMLSGTVEHSEVDSEGLVLLIGLNGVIYETTRLELGEDGKSRFAVILSDEGFVDGENLVEFLVIRDEL
jgi:hypothetical protein